MDGNATPTTATNAQSSSSALTTLLGQATEPGQEQPGQPAGQPDQPGQGGADPARGNPPGAGTTPPAPVEEPSQPAENGGGDAEGEPPAPDEQAYAGLAVPEGLTVDEAALGDFRKLAAEARLPVETAQRLLDLHTRLQAEAERSYAATVADWGKQTAADPFLSGGDVANGGFPSFKDATAAARRFLNTYGDAELRAALNASGMGNHPLLFKALARAGRDLASDSLVSGAGRPRVDTLHARYPNMPAEFFSN